MTFEARSTQRYCHTQLSPLCQCPGLLWLLHWGHTELELWDTLVSWSWLHCLPLSLVTYQPASTMVWKHTHGTCYGWSPVQPRGEQTEISIQSMPLVHSLEMMHAGYLALIPASCQACELQTSNVFSQVTTRTHDFAAPNRSGGKLELSEAVDKRLGQLVFPCR